MTRVVAGVFGRGAESAGPEVRRSLEDATGGLATESLALAWTGRSPVPGVRTVLVAGRVLNLRALAGELGGPPDNAEEIVALAYDRWGETMPSLLRGGFVVVVWDAATSSGLLAVDQLGVGGLFVHESAGRLSFATEVRHLLGLFLSRPALDQGSVVQWLADGYLARGATLYEGVRRLEGGHLVRLEAGRARTECYWTPRQTPPVRVDRSEAAAELGSALTRSVRARVAEDGPTGVQVSGGLDSSVVAAVASRLDPPVQDLRAYSLVHPEHPEIDESQPIEQVTSFLGLGSERVPMRGASALQVALEYQLAWQLPATSPMLAFTLPLLRRAAHDGVAVLLDGEGGDELLGCSAYLLADRLRRGDVRGAVSLARRIPGVGRDPTPGLLWTIVRRYGVKGAVPHASHRTMRKAFGARRYAPRWLTPQAATRYLALHDEWGWKKHAGPRWWSYLADLLTAGRERLGFYDVLRHRASLAGLESAHPLLEDLDLVELVLRLPPELAFDAELTRPLAREAVAGLLPDEVRLRPDKVDFSRLLIDALNGPDRALATRLLGAKDAELWAYAEPEKVGELLQRPLERRGTEWARLVARLATTEIWLRAQADASFPERLQEEYGTSLTDDGRAPRAGGHAVTS